MSGDMPDLQSLHLGVLDHSIGTLVRSRVALIINRVLQDLRGNGLIVLRGGLLSIPDWEALKNAAEFDPAYLHLKL